MSSLVRQRLCPPFSAVAQRLSREVPHDERIEHEQERADRVRMACQRDDLERKQRTRSNDDEPGAPPMTVDQRPPFDETERTVGEERYRDCPEPAATRRPDHELGEIEAPSTRVVLQVSSKAEQSVFEPHSHPRDEHDREDEPEKTLSELVRNDERQAAFASHAPECNHERQREFDRMGCRPTGSVVAG